MADFSIEFDKESDFIVYLHEFRQRIDLNAFFTAKLFIDGNMAFFHIKPLIFPFYWMAPIIWIMGSVFAQGFNMGVFVAGCVPGITFLLYTRYWYIMALYIGKWKGGYRGKIKVL